MCCNISHGDITRKPQKWSFTVNQNQVIGIPGRHHAGYIDSQNSATWCITININRPESWPGISLEASVRREISQKELKLSRRNQALCQKMLHLQRKNSKLLAERDILLEKDRQSHRTIVNWQTKNNCIAFVQCWTNVEDVGPTLYKWYTNLSCLLRNYQYKLVMTSPWGNYAVQSQKAVSVYFKSKQILSLSLAWFYSLCILYKINIPKETIRYISNGEG